MFIINTKRKELQQLLEKIVPNVYFQPPPSYELEYPAIIYSLSRIKHRHADNVSYNNYKSYKLTLVTEDPDNDYVDEILSIPMCSFNTHFCSDNLNHYVFELYY